MAPFILFSAFCSIWDLSKEYQELLSLHVSAALRQVNPNNQRNYKGFLLSLLIWNFWGKKGRLPDRSPRTFKFAKTINPSVMSTSARRNYLCSWLLKFWTTIPDIVFRNFAKGSVTKFKIMSDGHFDNSKQDKNYLKYILEQFTISKVEQ